MIFMCPETLERFNILKTNNQNTDENQSSFFIVKLCNHNFFCTKKYSNRLHRYGIHFKNVTEYTEANELLENRVQKWKVEIETQKGAIEQMKKDLSAEKVLLTKELVEERQEDIKALEETMVQYQQDRFGPEGDLVLQKRMLIQPIQDQVFNAVQDIAKNKRYDFIFDKSADVVMIYSEKRHDISDLILRIIGRTRKVSSRGNNENSIDDIQSDVNTDLEERKKLQEERKAERLKVIEENRQAKLNELEERKKAYEERRKKLLADREAAKKAKDEKKENKEDNKKEEEQKLN